ncbi:MAG: hypothetical protein GX456_16970 [Verrucomicrobia bacterium]|nr:hypothetical protein [Verrucomicrobiota bacterium]
MGVGKREALGVRQLAAALFLSPNNVSVPISACAGSYTDFGSRRLEQGTISGPRRNQGTEPKQRACHPIPTHCLILRCCNSITCCQRSRYGEIDQPGSVKIFANMNDFSR